MIRHSSTRDVITISYHESLITLASQFDTESFRSVMDKYLISILNRFRTSLVWSAATLVCWHQVVLYSSEAWQHTQQQLSLMDCMHCMKISACTANNWFWKTTMKISSELSLASRDKYEHAVMSWGGNTSTSKCRH